MTNDLAVFEQNNRRSYLSIEPKTIEEKKEVFNALESCDNLLNDCVGKEIEIKNIYIEEHEDVKGETGEVKSKFRTIIFAKEGTTYATGSYGVYNAIMRIIAIYGSPELWEEPIRVKVIKRKIKDNKTSLSLELL